VTPHRVDLLIAEDNPSDAELIVTCLANDGDPSRLVHVVRDGEETLDFVLCRGVYATRADTPPRVVLLDVSLPKIGGLEVLRILKSDPHTAPIPVVMLTSSAIERDVATAYRYGANSYVQKPLEFDRFRDTVRWIERYWSIVNEPPPGTAFPRPDR